ncbi:MAG: TROVE domain-containing protein [Planctomycetota bacterium]
MANRSLFRSLMSRFQKTDATNEAGGSAYQLEARHALAQLAATGTFGDVFYTTAEQQLETLQRLAAEVDDEYLAKLALYARERAAMKDMPAALLVILSLRNTELMHRVFDRVVDNGRMLRNVFQMVRSGQFTRADGRRRVGLSSSLQRAFQRWLNEASVAQLLSASIGNDPSLRDILRMARPTPRDNQRRALFGWLAGRDEAKWAPATWADLPVEVQQLEAYRRAETETDQVAALEGLRGVRWDLLVDAARGPLVWRQLARMMGHQALRMNLNTLLRHGVLEDSEMVAYVAERLGSEVEVARAGQFPHQYFAAYRYSEDSLPYAVTAALQRAAELACGNVPAFAGPVVVGLDVSGSMRSAVTGLHNGRVSSAMNCVDAAALFASAVLRRNPDSVVIPFDDSVYSADVDPGDTILSLADQLRNYGGGGTNCALPLEFANSQMADRSFAGVVLVSDNESWVDSAAESSGSTGVLAAWNAFVDRQAKLGNRYGAPKLVNLDLAPYTTVQAPERSDILNVGGFGDSVFETVARFLRGEERCFVSEVEAVKL